MNDIKGEYLNKVYRELYEYVGAEITKMIYDFYKGQQIFFPVNFFSIEYIRQQIINEYDSSNAKQLAIKYGYTEKWIKQVVKENSDLSGKNNKAE